MPRKIFAAMIEFESESLAVGSEKIVQFAGVGSGGFDMFQDAVNRADAELKGVAGGGAFLKIFLAPEYFFSSRTFSERGSLRQGSLGRDEKHDIYDKLKQVSAQFNDILIVAGSIAYTKKGRFSARKYLNVCPVAINGQIIHKYYKREHDSYQGGKDGNFTSKNYAPTFRHSGLTFGIEICKDHGGGKATLKGLLKGGAVDVQILVSAGAGPSAGALATRPGGVIINCDMSGKEGNGVRVGDDVVESTLGGTVAANGFLRRSQPLKSGGSIAIYQGQVS